MKSVPIKFLDAMGNLPPQIRPYPAKKNIPSWYKKLPSYVGDKAGDVSWSDVGTNGGTATGKKCIPMLDAMTAGYIIPLATDVKVTKKGPEQFFQWPDYEIVAFHPPAQMMTHPQVEKHPNYAIPKYNSPWVIITPPGYSCMFLPPLNRDASEQIIQCLPAIIDTDTYKNPINIPFIIDPEWEGIIPAGYPVAQVIPFKRENFEMVEAKPDDYREIPRTERILKMSFYNRYKDRFWHKKEYN
jgi:hypothetical protein